MIQCHAVTKFLLTVASPFFSFLFGCMGKRINLDLYSFRRCTFCCKDSTDLLRRRWSTAIPTDRAKPAFSPAPWLRHLWCETKLKMYKILHTTLLVINANLNKRTLISSSVNPLPARSFLWYRTVGHLTIGRKGPAAGLGAMARAFLILVCLLLYFRAGWLNQVFTNRCQSLWKCPLGIILFPLGAILALKRKQ